MSFKVTEDIDIIISKLVIINNPCKYHEVVLKYTFECIDKKSSLECSESLVTVHGDKLRVSPNKTELGPIQVNVIVKEVKGAELKIIF